MIKNEETSVDKLIGFLDNGTHIDPETTCKALDCVYGKKNKNKKLNEKERNLVYKIIRLINNRTQEVNDFIDVLNDKKMTDDEKNKFYINHYPFKDSNLKIEKLIFEAVYEVDEYKAYEDMIIDLIYDDLEDPDEFKDIIKTIMINNGINMNIYFDNEYKSCSKQRKK